jgi:formate hydrogenlyase subunit 3/multisubunit Na+/H+ antiporter MnhD subunit
MFDTIFGLPVHPLVIHAVVVLLPLASVAVLAAAFWPKFRRWAGPLPLITSVVATVLVPVATESGESLEQRLGAGSNPLVLKHEALGDLMIYWSIGLVVAAALVYWWHWQTKRADSSHQPKQALVIAIMVIAAIAGVGTLVHVIRVGDAGARAVWASTVDASQS